MQPEERYSKPRPSSMKLQVVLLLVFFLVVIGAVWIYEGSSEPGPSPAPSPAPAAVSQPGS